MKRNILAIIFAVAATLVLVGFYVFRSYSNQSYFSWSSLRFMPYLIAYPDGEPQGILIYMHGGDGDEKQGMNERIYKQSFKRLKELLKTQLHFVYVTTEATDSGSLGGRDLVTLAYDLHARYPNLPIYLSGGSAGGRTSVFALQTDGSMFSGAILLCPAVTDIQAKQGLNAHAPPIWIVQGSQDQLLSVPVVDKFAETLKSQGLHITYQKIEGGDHGAPIDQVDWAQALDFLKKN